MECILKPRRDSILLLSPVNYLVFQYNSRCTAVDALKWRQMMNFSEACVALAHVAHKRFYSRCNSFMTFLWILNWKHKHTSSCSIQMIGDSNFFFILELGSPAVQFIKVIRKILLLLLGCVVEQIYCLLYGSIQTNLWTNILCWLTVFDFLFVGSHLNECNIRLLMGS